MVNKNLRNNSTAQCSFVTQAENIQTHPLRSMYSIVFPQCASSRATKQNIHGHRNFFCVDFSSGGIAEAACKYVGDTPSTRGAVPGHRAFLKRSSAPRFPACLHTDSAKSILPLPLGVYPAFPGVNFKLRLALLVIQPARRSRLRP